MANDSRLWKDKSSAVVLIKQCFLQLRRAPCARTELGLDPWTPLHFMPCQMVPEIPTFQHYRQKTKQAVAKIIELPKRRWSALNCMLKVTPPDGLWQAGSFSHFLDSLAVKCRNWRIPNIKFMKKELKSSGPLVDLQNVHCESYKFTELTIRLQWVRFNGRSECWNFSVNNNMMSPSVWLVHVECTLKVIQEVWNFSVDSHTKSYQWTSEGNWT